MELKTTKVFCAIREMNTGAPSLRPVIRRSEIPPTAASSGTDATSSVNVVPDGVGFDSSVSHPATSVATEAADIASPIDAAALRRK
jgi:hypothetical protein